jgi:hypothetical protein
MMAKSLPLCLAGDFNKRSTFSSKTYFGLRFFNIQSISHQRTPLIPSIPLALVVATE